MRRAMVAIALGLGIATPAMADTIDVLKKNTLVLRQADGKVHTILVNDATELNQVNAAGIWARGIWAMKEGGFCWTARGASELCIPMPMDKPVGDTWDIHGPTGKLVWTAEIREGRADLEAIVSGIKAAKALDQAGPEDSHSAH